MVEGPFPVSAETPMPAYERKCLDTVAVRWFEKL